MNFYLYTIIVRFRNVIRGLFGKNNAAKWADNSILTLYFAIIFLAAILIGIWRYLFLNIHYISDNNLVSINIDIAVTSIVLYCIYMLFRTLLKSKKKNIENDFFYKSSLDKRKYSLFFLNYFFILSVLFMLAFTIPSIIIGVQYNINHYLIFPPLLFVIFLIFNYVAVLGDLYYYKRSIIQWPFSLRRILHSFIRFAFWFFAFSAVFYIIDVEYQEEYASSVSLFLKIFLIALLAISLHTIAFLPALKKNLFSRYPFLKLDFEINTSGSGSLIVDNSTFNYSSREVLSNVSFEIKPKTTYALIGLNGSGKTTLLNQLRDYSNNLRVQSLTDYLFMQAHTPLLSKMTIQEFMIALKLLNPSIDLVKMKDLLEKYHINYTEEKHLSNYPFEIRSTISYITAIALGLQVYLLDEPFNSPECESTDTLLNSFHVLKQTNKSIIIATNFLDIAYGFADEILLISNNSVTQIKNDFATFASFEYQMLELMKDNHNHS